MKNKVAAFSLAVLTMIFFLPFASKAEQNNVIRVGYIENYGIIKTPQVSGYEGYGYEYLYKILEYTQGTYRLEFVECTLGNATEKLRNGEIDLFAPASKTEEGNGEFIYTSQNLGRELRYLAATDPENISTGDYSILNHSIIGVDRQDPMLENLYFFLADNNISAEVKELDITSFHLALQDTSYDFLLTGSMLMESDMNVVASLSSEFAYFKAMPAQESLIADFNQAMTSIAQEEYLYQEQLYLKYFQYTYNMDNFITKSDFELMKFKSVYFIGVENLQSPLAFVNEEGEIDGIFRNIMDLIASDIGITVSYVLVEDNMDEATRASLDFSFVALDDPSRFLGVESDPLLQLPYMMIKHGSDLLKEGGRIGSLEHYGLSQEDVSFFLPGEELVEYDNSITLNEAFLAGEVGSMLITSAAFNSLSYSKDTTDYLASYLGYQLSPTIVFSEQFPKAKVEVLNKFIARLDPSEVEQIVLDQTVLVPDDPTFSDILKNNPIIINVFLGLIALSILAITLIERSKKHALLDLLNYDDVTGLYTEHCFLINARDILNKNTNKKYSILSLDIDNFKYINEIYGYEKGSLILKEFANFKENFHIEPLLACRCFSDKYIFFLESDGVDEDIRDKMLDESSLVHRCNKHLSGNYNFGYSVGMYQIESPDLDLNYMIDCANFARSLGKETMGITFFMFTEEMRKERDTSNMILSQTDHALNNHEFVMYYQPKIELTSEKVTGAEALVRWIREGKMVPPGDFIPLFEKNGFIEKLDYYVLDAVCTFIQQNWRAKLPVLSVNLSGISVLNENLVENIMEVLDRHQVKPNQIDLEITESAFVENFHRALSRLERLRALGFTISMDDFGAGISSLGRLKEIPIDILKIDREFIVDSLENEKGNKIIMNIVRMAKDIQVETVAEGIETIQQLNFLKGLGCDVGQGYYFSRPLQKDDFLNFIQ